jgi:hypothetical protein
MNISFKSIIAAIAAVFMIAAAVWGTTEYFTPREITKMLIADLQKNQIQIQKQLQFTNRQQRLQDAKNWYDWYQSEVNRLTRECAYDPNNQNKRLQLEQYKQLRNRAKGRWDQLMRQ